MTKNTPGPWIVKSSGTIQAETQSIAECYGLNTETRCANAKLIAAAPVMLQLLQDLIGFDSIRKACAKQAALNLLQELATEHAVGYSTEGNAFPSVGLNNTEP
jgi:hypothetical protein